MDYLKQYNKAIVAFLTTAVSLVVAALAGDNSVDIAEWSNVVVMAAGAAAVLVGPNVPGAKYTKAVLSAIIAVAVLFVSVATDGVVGAEWWQLLIAFLTPLGVYRIPNKPGPQVLSA